MPGYSGEPIRKTGVAGQTCIIDWSGGDKLLDKFAIGSSASITLLFDDEDEVTELQNISDKTVVVKVYNNGGTSLYWQGYLISDGVQHPDSGVVFPIQLTAVDMLEASNEIAFNNTDVGAITIGVIVGSEKSPLNWIRKCLALSSNMGNDLPIRWSCSVKNSQYPTDDFFGGRTSWIYNYEEFQASRQETFTGWMLENIAKSVGCLLFQNGGYWYIVSLKDLAVSTTLTFNQISAGLGAKTATTVSINLSKIMPNKLNESTYSMVQKPISKVKSTYNHSMPTNIIPNGGFDIVESGRPLYWDGSNSNIQVTSSTPINGRISGYSVRLKNIAVEEGFANFEIDGINSIPFDANILFKTMQWGFTFSPINYPTDGDGYINWALSPLQMVVSYTGYDNSGNFKRFFLNDFGYWESREILVIEMKIDTISFDGATATVSFSGNPQDGQTFSGSYLQDGSFFNIPTVSFSAIDTLEDALIRIASQTGAFYNVGELSVTFSFTPSAQDFSAEMGEIISIQPKLRFAVDGMKNSDVATVQFQSKGNQGNILMPNPRTLDDSRLLDSGKLSVKIIVKDSQEVIFDDLYMNVSSDKEYWDITDGGTDGKEEYELDISSSFSGFMTSSYMDNFAKSDLSMTMTNGLDNGTLTELFGKTALRMLSNPTKKIDTDLEGSISLLNLLQYGGAKYLPLKSSVNTETNESKLTIFELNYDDGLIIDSVHKSTGDGESSGIGGNGSGGGGGGGGIPSLIGEKVQIYLDKGLSSQGFLTIPTSFSEDPLAVGKWQIYIDEDGEGGDEDPLVINLTDLGDVVITSPTNGQALIYNSTTGKWVNGAGGGGGGSIATLTDVTLTSLANGQILVYNSTLGKWVNSTNFAGNAATVTNGVYTTGSYSNPSWIASLAAAKITSAPWLTIEAAVTVFQPLENQRLSTSNNVSFNRMRATNRLDILGKNSVGTPSGNFYELYVQE